MNKQGLPSINRHQDSRSVITIIDTDGTLSDVTGIKEIRDEQGNAWTGTLVKGLKKEARLGIRLTAPNSFTAGSPGENGTLYITLTDGKNDIGIDPMQVNYVNDDGM
jgi:hypothetical protein